MEFIQETRRENDLTIAYRIDGRENREQTDSIRSYCSHPSRNEVRAY